MGLLCKIGWHSPTGFRTTDGCSLISRCKRCGAKIMLDSQGNWFRTEDQKYSKPESIEEGE